MTKTAGTPIATSSTLPNVHLPRLKSRIFSSHGRPHGGEHTSRREERHLCSRAQSSSGSPTNITASASLAT